MVSYEDSTPTWVNVTVKTLATIVLITSLTFLSTSTWSLATDLKPSNSTSRTNFIVQTTSHSVSIATTLLQSISSLTLLFNCTPNLKTPSYKWIVTQTIMLVIIIVGFLIPFTFNSHGGQESASKFVEKTNEHFRTKAREWDFRSPHHANTYAFLLHFISVVVGCVVVGGVVRFGVRSGYQAVR